MRCLAASTSARSGTGNAVMAGVYHELPGAADAVRSGGVREVEQGAGDLVGIDDLCRCSPGTDRSPWSTMPMEHGARGPRRRWTTAAGRWRKGIRRELHADHEERGVRT